MTEGIDEVVGLPKQSMDIHVPIVPIGSMYGIFTYI